MRNPWPIFSTAALTVAACLIYDHFFSYQTIWIAVVAIIALLILGFLGNCQYERWLAHKINPYVVEYQKNHDIEKLKHGLDCWRPWAITRHSKNIMLANWFSALLEQKRWSEAEAELEKYLHRAKTTQDKIGYHLLKIDYARAIGDTELEEKEQFLSKQLRSQLGNKKDNPKKPASAKQCKVSFFLWLSFCIALSLFGLISVTLWPDSIVGSLGAGLYILSWFALPVALVWLVLWPIRRSRERKEGTK